MEYLLITVLQIVGGWLHAAQKVAIIKKNQPSKKFNEVLSLFWQEDWNTFCFSMPPILILNLVGHFAMVEYGPESITSHPWYIIGSLALAVVLGYAGQRIVYKYLGTAENVLDKQAAKLS
jgi:hypothetical protein